MKLVHAKPQQPTGLTARALRWALRKGFGYGDQWLGGSGFGFAHRRAPRSQADYAARVGNGLSSSVLMSPVRWIQRTLPEAPVRLQLAADESDIPDHAMLQLLRKPNEFLPLSVLLQAAIYSFVVDGNAYWIKRRAGTVREMPWYENVTGEVQELWWIPHWRMRPVAPRDGSQYISHYRLLLPRGGQVDVPRENIIHFRNGIDPDRPAYGMSFIYSELREIWTDDEAAAFTAALLRNTGIPGLVVAPKAWPSGDGEEMAIIPDPDAVKKYIRERFGGSNRGEALVMQAPTEVTILGFSPQQMDLSSIRNVVEERICSALGIQAAVLGFGTGLQQTKVGAVMHELVRLSWTGCIIPIQKVFASQLALSLLPEYESDPEKFLVLFDVSQIQALREDKDALYKRLNQGVAGGWIRVDHAQALAGLEVDDTQAVYLRRQGVLEVPAEMVTRPFLPPPEP